MAPGNAPGRQVDALAELSQLVCVSIQPTILADVGFRQRAEDCHPREGEDLQELLRRPAGTNGSCGLRGACANRIGMVHIYPYKRPSKTIKEEYVLNLDYIVIDNHAWVDQLDKLSCW